MKIFDKIDNLYVRGWINKEEWEELTLLYIKKLEKLYLRGLVTEDQYKKYSEW